MSQNNAYEHPEALDQEPRRIISEFTVLPTMIDERVRKLALGAGTSEGYFLSEEGRKIFRVLKELSGTPSVEIIRLKLRGINLEDFKFDLLSYPLSEADYKSAIQDWNRYILERKTAHYMIMAHQVGLHNSLTQKALLDLSEFAKKGLSAEEDLDCAIKTTPEGGLNMTDLSLITNFDNPRFYVDNFLVRNSYTIIHGAHESCKSLLSVELARALSTETPFLGKYTVNEKCKVLIIDEENSQEYLKRMADGLELRSSNNNIKWCLQLGVKVDNPEDRKALMKTLDDEDVQVVIFDSLSRIHSKNENTDEMKEIGNILMRIARRGVTVVAIHHDNRTGTYRGFSDIPAAADQVFSVRYDKPKSIIDIIPEKTRLANVNPITVSVQFLNPLRFVVLDIEHVLSEKEKIAQQVSIILSRIPEGMSKTKFRELFHRQGVSNNNVSHFIDDFTDKYWWCDKTGKNNEHIYRTIKHSEDTNEMCSTVGELFGYN